MPKVSVLTPIYNTNPKHLRECIESILNQTFKDFEFLILNDSPDNKEIESIVKEYAKQDKRVKYYKNEKNMGITPSRNKLLGLASGEYVAIFDHDDISVPDRLEKQVKYLDENPYCGVVSGWLEYFGDDNRIQKNPEYDVSIKRMLTVGCYVAHTAAMIRKSVLVDNNIEYEEYYTPAEDYRLWQRLMEVTHFYNIQQVLVKYRWNQNNTSNVKNKEQLSAGYNIIMQIANKYPVSYQEQKSMQEFSNTIRLFGFIPFLKIKNDKRYVKVYLFDFILLLKIKKRFCYE